MKGILLDTHVWIWLMEGSHELNPKYRKMINQAAQNSAVNIAAISMWEISMLAMKKKIIFEKPILQWLNESLALPGMELKPLTPDIAAESTELPEIAKFHGDPADRLIVATARIHGLTLLTHDKKIINYAKSDYISVLPI
ncbi:MAG TPA: type II toxin-antitoxin system VapC family toxin [Gammaproteobacteria bacterium]|jgi:PIN domain nuclease of toxin-antitoxin system|nr:type II toxin-antitoxin system VapC family toxin [Gammaproteobacteria bacterium]